MMKSVPILLLSMFLLSCTVKNVVLDYESEIPFLEPVKSIPYEYEIGLKKLNDILSSSYDYRVRKNGFKRTDYLEQETLLLERFPEIAKRDGDDLILTTDIGTCTFRTNKLPPDEIDYTVFTLANIDIDSKWVSVIKTGYEWANIVLLDLSTGDTVLISGWETIQNLKEGFIAEAYLPGEKGDGTFGVGLITKTESGFQYEEMIVFKEGLVRGIELEGNTIIFDEIVFDDL